MRPVIFHGRNETKGNVCTGVAALRLTRGSFCFCLFQPAVQDASARSALRPARVRPTSSATDLLGSVCVRAQQKTVNKVETPNSFSFPQRKRAELSLFFSFFFFFPGCGHVDLSFLVKFSFPLPFLPHLIPQTRPSGRAASWFPCRPARRSPGEPSGASWCWSSWWCCCWCCCSSTAGGRRTNRTTRRPSPSPPAAPSTRNTLCQVRVKDDKSCSEKGLVHCFYLFFLSYLI